MVGWVLWINLKCCDIATGRSAMYISKEDYDIYFNDELIKDVVDIDVCEVLRLGDKGIGACQDILVVTFLGPKGMLLQVRDSAEQFRFEKKQSRGKHAGLS